MGCSPSRLPGDTSQSLPLMPGCFMATYQIQPDYAFSEELQVYGEDTEKMSKLPPPHPPSQTKDEIFDPNLFTKLDRRADKAPAKLLKEHYSSLMHYLLDGVKDPLGKVRVIYRWITAQNVDKILVPKNAPEVTTPLHQVWKIRNKKGNYAQLVSIMCRLAGVPCVIIHGKLKGSTYEVGTPVDEKTHYGEWNAVLINDDWWFLNAYWGACALGSNGDDDWVEVETGEEVKADGEGPAPPNGRQSKAEKEFMYVCDENYFLAEPKQMVSTHLPTVEAWQLLNEPVSPERFQTMAFLKDRFFNLRMSVISHPDCVITSHSGDVELLFGIPEEDSLFLKFYFLLFRLDNRKAGEAAPKYDRYVFLHKKRPDLLSLRVRTPVSGTFRLELVGKDTRVTTPQYDYDWVCLYKMHFEFAADKCLPFPETPMLGWGPGTPTLELGLAPLNHLSGLVPAGSNGETRLSFMVRDPDIVSQLQFSAMLVKGGVREQLCRDRVVHRLEHGQLVFNVATPKPGEYRIALNAARKDNPDQVENFCNYLITSDQKERRAAYPRGFEGVLGQKPACSRLGIIPLSHHSGMIYTETGEVQLSFKLTQPVDVTLSVVGNDIMISDSKRLVHETMEDHVVTYVVRLPTNGNFGLRVIGKAKDGGVFESVYDYVIQYPKSRGQQKPENGADGTLRALPPRREDAVVKMASDDVPGVVPDMSRDELPPPTMVALSSPTPLNTPAMDGEEGRVQELEKYVEVAAATQDRSELENALAELQKMKSDKASNIIALANRELDIMNVRTELKEATEARNLKRLLKAISLAKEKGYERFLKEELRDATALKDRLAHIQKLLHDVLDLDQKTFAEIRGYSKPPAAVQAVMQGTLLLLGHFDEETNDWSRVQAILGKTGRENVRKRMERLDVDSVAVDVALGTKKMLEGITLDNVLAVSAGAAAFYVWSKGVVDEVETRYGEEARSARPRTSKSRRARRHGREPSFLK